MFQTSKQVTTNIAPKTSNIKNDMSGSNDLIVPFPSSRRRSSSSSTGDSMTTTATTAITTATTTTIATATKPSSMDRHVRFSAHSSLRIYQRSKTEERTSRWYSNAEYKCFRRIQLLELSDARRVVRSSPKSIDHDDLLGCLGLTTYLSDDLLKRVLLERKLHVQKVLDKQRHHVRDDEGLSRVSKASSEWSRIRAHEIAILYHTIGDDSVVKVPKNLWSASGDK